MHTVLKRQSRWIITAGLAVLALLCVSLPASAQQMTSTNFKLNGTTNGSFGGTTGSSSYGLFSTGGGPVIGRGTSGSYILGEGFTAQQEQSIQLTSQPSGLLGYWNFDESTGSRYTDASATRADANKSATNPSDITSTTGKIGNGLAASGANGDSNIRIPSGAIQPSSVTVELWTRVNSFGGDSNWDSVCSYYAVTGEDWGPWEFYTDGDNSGSNVNFLWSIHTGTQHAITTAPLNLALNTWHHLVGTYDASTGISKIYVNGVQRATGTFAANPLNYTVANSDNQISCFNSGRWPGEGIQGGVDQLKIFNRALTADEVTAEYSAQNAGTPTGLTLGTVTPGSSNTALNDIIIRTDSASYGVSLSQNHHLQKGLVTIPPISGGTIASPTAWSEGTTKGLGFTLLNAPALDSKWGTGANYAAVPSSATSFYTRANHSSSETIDTLNSRFRLDTSNSQEVGQYSNTVTYTATTIP